MKDPTLTHVHGFKIADSFDHLGGLMLMFGIEGTHLTKPQVLDVVRALLAVAIPAPATSTNPEAHAEFVQWRLTPEACEPAALTALAIWRACWDQRQKRIDELLAEVSLLKGQNHQLDIDVAELEEENEAQGVQIAQLQQHAPREVTIDVQIKYPGDVKIADITKTFTINGEEAK